MKKLCKTYAMDKQRRSSLLNLLELKTADHKIAKIVHEAILDPNADKIVNYFYEYLLQFKEYSSLLDPDLIPALKQTQTAYVRSFGVDFDGSDYFEHRLRVGLVHNKVGLTLGLYQCAYRELQQLMLNEIPENFHQDDIYGRDLCCFIHKITTLDMTLAIETYHGALVMDIKDELDTAHIEKEALRQRVRTDSLTGLSTRDYGIAVLNSHLVSEKDNPMLCLLMIDIDFFKAVNDTYGHLAGDAVLRQVSKIITSAVRDFDVISRFGGEEFMIVLSRATKDIALKVAKRIRQLVAEHPVDYGGNEIAITLSQGIASAEPGSNATQLLNEADIALYKAKKQGRDCIVMSGADVIRN